MAEGPVSYDKSVNVLVRNVPARGRSHLRRVGLRPKAGAFKGTGVPRRCPAKVHSNCGGMRQMFATSPVVVFILSRRDHDGDGGNILLLSAWNTAMHEYNATCTVQQRSHPMINLRPDPNASVPGGNTQSSSFEEIAYIKTNPERACGKAQSPGDDADTVSEVVSGFLLCGVSVSLVQVCVRTGREIAFAGEEEGQAGNF